MSAFSVYALCDPRTGEIRYVGYSCDPYKRFVAHCRDAMNTHKVRWINKLWDETGEVPDLRVLCIVQHAEEAKRVEVAFIARLRARGVLLTNTTLGGDGGSPMLGRHHGEEAKAKIGTANRGAPFAGKRHSDETKERIAATKRGDVNPAKRLDVREKMSAIKRGRKFIWNEPHRENHKRAVSSADTRARMSASRIGNCNPFFGRKTYARNKTAMA